MAAIIVGLGEALFDIFPHQEFLGGAPLNMAVHAGQLGNSGVVASRVGTDQRGDRVLAALAEFGVQTDCVQRDAHHATGIVQVTFDDGEPNYDIVRDVAWDYLAFDESWARLAASCDAVCFGTLAQRSPTSRAAIHQFLQAAHRAVRLFDVNLRQQYYDRPTLVRSMELATAVKLNDHELNVLRSLLSLTSDRPARLCEELLTSYQLQFVAWTRGAQGTSVVDREGMHTSAPVVVDTTGGTPVGAGDATSAALIHGYLAGWPWSRTLELANHLGAYVATQSGACPKLNDAIRDMLRD